MKESQSQGQSTQHMQEPLSDLAYDWVTIIQHKSEALRAYEKYMQDAQQANSPECADLMRQIYEQDANHVQQATRHLVEILRNGKMGQGSQMSSGQGSQSMRGGSTSSSQGMGGSMGQGESGRQGMRQSSTSSGGTSQSGQGQAASRQGGMQGMQQGEMQENEMQQGRDVIEGRQQRRSRS